MANSILEPGCCSMGQDDSSALPADIANPNPPTAPAPVDSGGLWSSITSIFSSSTPDTSSQTSSPDQPVTPVQVAPDPSEMYSKYFTLGQLCVTSLPYPNLPLDTASQNNLKQLGILLDAIQDNIGTFTIASAYRSPANQAALQAGAGGAAAASMAVSKSFHSLGLAADITPTNGMTPTQFAQAIYNNPITNVLCGQLVDKSEGGNETSLHISCVVPTGNHIFLKATPMYVGAGGAYIRMTPAQISAWQSSSANELDENIEASLDQSSEDAGSMDSDSDDSSLGWAALLVVGALAGGGYLYYAKKKRG